MKFKLRRAGLRILTYLPFLAAAGFIAVAFPFADAATDAEREAAASIIELYGIIKTIAVPLAVVGLTWSGVTLITNTDVATATRVKRQIIIICLALAAVLLIPAIFKSGIGLTGGWDPNNPI